MFAKALTAEVHPWPLHRARLLLANGRRLHRLPRSAEARTPLREARELFHALGARQGGELAQHALRAAGETGRQSRPGLQ